MTTREIPPSKQPEGTFPWMLQQFPGRIENRPITPRENQKLVYDGKIPMWMPMWLYDNQYCWPDVVLEHPPYEQDGFDWWGTEWVMVESAGGMMVKPGFVTVTDFDKWEEQMPIPNLDEVDFVGDAKLQTARYDDERMHVFHCPEGLFERLHEAMPFDEALVLMYEEREKVLDFFSKVADFKIDLLERVFKHYDPIDYVIYGDDWGTQRAGFFSNEMFRELIMPHTTRIWDYIHSQGKYIELHSCGLTQQYIDEIIEMGCDAWTPQDINDFDMLTEKYGNQITLTVPIPGVLDNSKSEEELRQCVRDFVDKYAPRGRIIAGAAKIAPERSAILKDELFKYSSAYYQKMREEAAK